MGIYGVLAKPFDLDEVAAVVRGLAGAQAPAQPTDGEEPVGRERLGEGGTGPAGPGSIGQAVAVLVGHRDQRHAVDSSPEPRRRQPVWASEIRAAF
jgi:hypothetical protein